MPPLKSPYIIPIFISHLGCPFQCLYCQQERITGQEAWVPSQSQIQDRVSKFLATRKPDKYSHTEIAFYGGTFTGLDSQVLENLLAAVSPFLRSGEVRSLRASTKPDYIFPETLPRLRHDGMETIELGVQSLDDAVLKTVGRGYSAERVRQAVRDLREHGFRVGIQLMQGLPGADEAEALQSARRAIELRPDFVRIYPTVILAGTALAQLYQQGRYQPWSLERAIAVCRQIKALFQAAEIPIIKMGLEFSTDEQVGILGGPYHPRFRQLVELPMAV